MAKKQPIKEDKEKPESSDNQQKLTTKPIKQKDHKKEKKPKFQELLNKEEKKASLNESSLPGSEDEFLVDENIVEISGDFIGIFFQIWHERNKDVPPLSDKEKANISVPLAKIVAKYDLKKYMKEEFVLFFYLGGAIYKRAKIAKVKKDDKDDNRKEGTRQDESTT